MIRDRRSWRKSSHSGTGNGNCIEVSWRKSSYSGNTGTGDCVEVAFEVERVGVRDSKNAIGSVLEFGPDAWVMFARNVADQK